MNFFNVDQLHLLGGSATHPIEPPGTRLGALLLLAGRSLLRPTGESRLKGLGMWRWLGWLCCLAPWPLHAEVFWGVLQHVSDGDTFWVVPDEGRVPQKLRLLGLDAPEICQAGGVASRDMLQSLVANKRLRVTVNFRDKYGRGLARVWVEGQDVGALMVQSGHAWSSRWHHRLGPYARQEAQARVAHLGVFADASAQWPGDFRKHFGSCYPAR